MRMQHGFTLIELLVTLTIVSILMFVASPSLQAFQRNAEMSAVSSTMLSSINAARGEAMKRARNTFLSPADGANLQSGWVVYVDMDNSRSLTNGDFTVTSARAIPNYLNVTGNRTIANSPPYLMFDASGYPRDLAGGFAALTLSIARNDVTASEQLSNTRRLIIASTGRVRLCNPSTDTTCTANANI